MSFGLPAACFMIIKSSLSSFNTGIKPPQWQVFAKGQEGKQVNSILIGTNIQYIIEKSIL